MNQTSMSPKSKKKDSLCRTVNRSSTGSGEDVGSRSDALQSLQELEERLVHRAGHLQELIDKHHKEARRHYAHVVWANRPSHSPTSQATPPPLTSSQIHRYKQLTKASLARKRVCKKRLEHTEQHLEHIIDLRDTLENAQIQADINQSLCDAQRVLTNLEQQGVTTGQEICDATDTFISTTQELMDAIRASPHGGYEGDGEQEEELLAELAALTADDAAPLTPPPAMHDNGAPQPQPRLLNDGKDGGANVVAQLLQENGKLESNAKEKGGSKNKKGKERGRVKKEKAKLQGLQTSV